MLDTTFKKAQSLGSALACWKMYLAVARASVVVKGTSGILPSWLLR